MQKVFDKLRELQKILLNEFETEAELEEIPRELNDLKKRFHKLEQGEVYVIQQGSKGK